MKYFGSGISEKHKELSSIIRKTNEIEVVKQLFLDIHAKLHDAIISHSVSNEVNHLFDDLKKEEYAIMPTKNDETIAWVLWHIARIEDITMNILVAKKEQIFDDVWKKRLSVSITDTGNALSDDEIMRLSKEVDIEALHAYRNEVGKATRAIIQNLQVEDMKRKVDDEDIKKILFTGGVCEDENSLWLLQFWGKKDVAGLLLMPPTRHVLMHLNDCCKWKEHIRNGKKLYRV